MRRLFLGIALSAALPHMLAAGPFNDFETDLRAAYADYRAALFQSNSGKAEATSAALTGLSGKWTALRAAWGATPPPQYADDAGYPATLARVEEILGLASTEVAAGDLPAAHETLEAIRDELGALHLRNGLVGFSDRMNAYHEKMETVLMTDYAARGADALGALREDAAVLAHLAAEIAAHPAPEAADPAYAPLVADLQKSVDAVLQAARGGELQAAIAAAKALKMPYAKLFARFG